MTDLAELPHNTTRGVFRLEEADTAEARSAHKATIVRRSIPLVARREPVPDVQAPLVAAVPGRSDDLLERAGQLAVLKEALASAGRDRRGALAVICGEAGVGKTALLRSFCDEVARSQRVLWGTCDPLFTPRPFGPLFAIAEGTGGELGPPWPRAQTRTRWPWPWPESSVRQRRRCWCWRTSTGPMKRPSTFSCCSSAGRKPRRRWWSGRTATTRSRTPTHCAGSWVSSLRPPPSDG